MLAVYYISYVPVSINRLSCEVILLVLLLCKWECSAIED